MSRTMTVVAAEPATAPSVLSRSSRDSSWHWPC